MRKILNLMKLKTKAEILKVFEVEILQPAENAFGELYFRIEVLRDVEDPHLIRAKIWRRDFYRLQPSFPQNGGSPSIEPSDEQIWVEETSLAVTREFQPLSEASDVLNTILLQIEQQFFP